MSSSTTLGERIKILRGTVPQRQFAQALGIPQTTLANYETNKSELSISMIRLLTRRYGVNTDWLVFGEGPQWADSCEESEDGNFYRLTPEEYAQKKAATKTSSSSKTLGDSKKMNELLVKLQTELDLERKERREVAAENRQLNKDKMILVQENADLKVRLAKLEMSMAATPSCQEKSASVVSDEEKLAEQK